MRALLLLIVAVGCGGARTAMSPYRVSAPDTFEVGEDAMIAVEVTKVSEAKAQLVITRPDGTIVKEEASLDTPLSKVRFGRPPPHPGLPPTFTITGAYKVELHVDDKVVAKTEVIVERDRIDDLLPMESVADYKQITRYTRPKIYGTTDPGKSYGAIYSPAWKVEARVEITIDEPGKHLASTWKLYREEGTPAVIEDQNVIFRERTESVTASWHTGDKIIRMQAPSLEDLERGIIAHFLRRFPSKLEAAD